MGEVTAIECTDRGLVLVRAEPDGTHATTLGIQYGRAVRDGEGVLTMRTAPDAWLLLVPAARVAPVIRQLATLGDGEFVSVVDVTHGHTLVRLTGAAAGSVLARVCAIDLAETAAPDTMMFRSLVAGVSATVIRDDVDGERSYLVQCDRSYGRYLIDVLRDARVGLDSAAPTSY